MNSRGSVLPGSQNLGQWSTYFFLKRANRKYFQLYRLNDLYRGFPNGSVVKNLPAKTGYTRDAGSIPWLSKIPGKQEMATHFSVLAWKIPWTEESGRLPSMGSQRVRHDLATEHAHSLCSMNTQHHGSTRYCFCTLWNECAWALIIFFNRLKMQKHFLVHEYNKVSGRSEFLPLLWFSELESGLSSIVRGRYQNHCYKRVLHLSFKSIFENLSQNLLGLSSADVFCDRGFLIQAQKEIRCGKVRKWQIIPAKEESKRLCLQLSLQEES